MRIEEAVKSDIHRKIIAFFHENQASIDTPRGISTWIREERTKVKQALEDYAVAAPQVSYTRPQHMMLRVASTGGSETMNVKADERSIDKAPSTETSAA